MEKVSLDLEINLDVCHIPTAEMSMSLDSRRKFLHHELDAGENLAITQATKREQIASLREEVLFIDKPLKNKTLATNKHQTITNKGKSQVVVDLVEVFSPTEEETNLLDKSKIKKQGQANDQLLTNFNQNMESYLFNVAREVGFNSGLLG